MGFKLFLFLQSFRTRITQGLQARVTCHSSAVSGSALRAEITYKASTHALLPAACSRGSRLRRSPRMDVSPPAAPASALLCPRPSCPGVPGLLSPTCTPRRLQIHRRGAARRARHRRPSQHPATAGSKACWASSLTCSDGHSEGIAASHHGDLHCLEPLNQVGYAAVAAGVGAQLPVLVAPKGVTLARC